MPPMVWDGRDFTSVGMRWGRMGKGVMELLFPSGQALQGLGVTLAVAALQSEVL